MKIRNLLVVCSFVILTGCATGYSLVPIGTQSIAGMSINAGDGWNMAPRLYVANSRQDAQTWTQDGMLLDRIVFIPAVPDGEALLVTRRDDTALPVFRADMLPNEIEELVESTIVKYFGEGNATASTSNLRPHRYGSNNGIMFNVSVLAEDSPEYKGTVGSFVANDHLYMIWYFGAHPYYYEKHQEQAEAIIQSARLEGT